MERVLALLRGAPGLPRRARSRRTSWGICCGPGLGVSIERLSLPLPGVAVVQAAGGVDLGPLAPRLEAAAPGTLIESHGAWLRRLSALARSLQACAAVATMLVAAVAVAVVSVATRAGLSARRETIEIVHGLGATDGYIAARFAKRAARLATAGGIIRTLAAMPVLLGLAYLAAPFAGREGDAAAGPLTALPAIFWLAVPGLPATAGLLGLLTAQATVRRWLRRLP